MVSNGCISNHNKMRSPRLKFNLSLFLFVFMLFLNQYNFVILELIGQSYFAVFIAEFPKNLPYRGRRKPPPTLFVHFVHFVHLMCKKKEI